MVVGPREPCAARYQLSFQGRAAEVRYQARIGGAEFSGAYTATGTPRPEATRFTGESLFFAKGAALLLRRCPLSAPAQLEITLQAPDGARVSTSLPRPEREDLLLPDTLGELSGALLSVGREAEIQVLGGALTILPGASDPAPLLDLARTAEALFGPPDGRRLLALDSPTQDTGRDLILDPKTPYTAQARALGALWFSARSPLLAYYAATLPARARLVTLPEAAASLSRLEAPAARLLCQDAQLFAAQRSLAAVLREARAAGSTPPPIPAACQADPLAVAAPLLGLGRDAKGRLVVLDETIFGAFLSAVDPT